MQLSCSFSIVCLFVVLVVDVSKGQFYEGDACVLQNGDNGVCKPLEACSGINNTIASGRYPKICSFLSLKPVVCCPTIPNTIEGRPSTTATSSTAEERRAPSNSMNYEAIHTGDACVLQNGDDGVCKPLEACPGINNTIASGRFPKICSFVSLKPVVCCPTIPNTIEGRPTTTTTSSTAEERRAPSNIGDVCSLNNGSPGECKRLQDCPKVRDRILSGNAKNVRTCGLVGTSLVVCCPVNNSTLSVTAQNRPEPPSNRPTTTRPTRLPADRTTTASPTSSAVGAKSASMCAYFSQFVFATRESAALFIIPEYYNESMCNSREYKANQAPLRDVEEALYIEFPHLASLGYGNETSIKWLCTGSLINERFILTTAHCLRSPNHGKVRWVDIGNLRPTVTSSDSRPPFVVAEWIRHEDYHESSPTKHDIALIRVERDVDVSPYGGRSRPACLYTLPGNPPQHRFATAVGWGRTHWDDTTTTVSLMKKDLTFARESECASSNQRSSGNNSSIICMSDPYPEESSCVGDMGGPIQIVLEAPYCMQAVVGLTSYGSRACANATSSAVYTRVSDYIAWIEGHVWP